LAASEIASPTESGLKPSASAEVDGLGGLGGVPL